LEVEEGTRPVDLIQRFEIPREMAHLVMIDGYHLLPDEVENRVLQPGEVLAIFPPIAGGR
ncbi:MAG: MoaD/ThiS family protein, partial [bacterium]